MPLTLAALMLSTLVSEDLACVAAGVLIARGDLSPAAGIVACALGICLGDWGLWALGRFGGRFARAWPSLQRRLDAARAENAGRWLNRHAGLLILGSRFTPGARLPLYLTAGLLRMSPLRFGLWTVVAVTMWTPAVVLAAARAGQAGAEAGGGVVWPLAAAAAGVLVMSGAARACGTSSGRAAVRAGLGRLGRWEFWPAWVFYAPVALWVALLAVRHRGLSTITCSNPGIADGGLVGESKADILEMLPPEYTIPSRRLVIDGEMDALRAALNVMAAEGWTFPVVLKPDVGQRGVGVRLIRGVEPLAAYVSAARGDLLMQPYHEGPCEAGIFYYRLPGQERGRIYSITDKHFPVVTGDGTSTLRELVNAHPRYRLQAHLFLARHAEAADTVLAAGERKQLAMAGNHAQGTTFRDGQHLLTPQLEHRIDTIARRCPGFFIGRFDVRYRDIDAFKAGRDLAIVELNGATAESTNIYDPDRTLLAAYRTLFRQWALVFEIGAANRAGGAVPTPLRRLLRLVATHLTATAPHPLAD